MWREALGHLREWRRLLSPQVGVSGLSLSVESKVVEPSGAEVACATVVDGLESFCEQECSGVLRDVEHSGELRSRSSVIDVGIGVAGLSRVREFSRLIPELAVFHQQMLHVASPVEQSIPRFERNIRVGQVLMLKTSEQIPCLSAGCVPETSIHEATPRMRTFPHMRKAVNPDAGGELFRESYLREAETANGITSGEGEILAVFRNVPVSMISRFRLLAESGVLLYTISASDSSTRARVHEVAAVRDKARMTTHLVAHRTKYKTVHLD